MKVQNERLTSDKQLSYQKTNDLSLFLTADYQTELLKKVFYVKHIPDQNKHSRQLGEIINKEDVM